MSLRCVRFARPLLALPLMLPVTLQAEPFTGTLVAERACPAGVSTKHAGNPGEIWLMPGESYAVVARNRAEPTHYQLRIPAAEPRDRWVEVDCGRLASASPVPAPAQASAEAAGVAAEYVLAASWQPAFCEFRQRLPECRGQTSERADTRQFSLHGLWPQPIGRAYCGVARSQREAGESGDWQRLPEPDLSPSTRTALEQRMPGTRSQLDRHEWAKHGTCSGTDAETYFRRSMALLDELNGSEVRRLFESRLGKRLRAEEVRAAFDRAFGPGSGERVRLECDQAGQITELRVGLKGQIRDGTPMGGLIQAAPTAPAGCGGGWVDRAGPGR